MMFSRRHVLQLFGVLPVVESQDFSIANPNVKENDMMGDTALGWAHQVAGIAYGTYITPSVDQKMRREIVEAAFLILKRHYDPMMRWENFWKEVVFWIKELQKEDLASIKSGNMSADDDYSCHLSIESMFGITEVIDSRG